MPEKKEARVTVATGRMAANMKALIEHMRAGSVTADAVTDLLGYGLSGARKYLHKLRDANVVKVTPACHIKHLAAIYSLVEDEDAIAAYLEVLLEKQPSVEHIQRQEDRSGHRRNIDGSLPGSHIYTSRDDPCFSTRKIDNQPVVVRRHWLDSALFGDGPARSVAGSV